MKLKEYFDYTPYADILHLTKYELTFCIGYFISAMILCFYSTQGGSLFSPDSTAYVSNAENIFNIFPNYYEGPVYPLLIAIGMVLGFSSEQSASIVPIICYSLLGFPLFLLSKIISRPITGYITCAITLLCGKYLLFISSYAWTDMPYLLLTVIAVAFLAIYNKYGYMSSIALAAIFTLASELTRVIGITLFMAGIVVIMINTNNATRKKSIIAAANYSIIAAVPFFIWTLISDKSSILAMNSARNPPIEVMILTFRSVIEKIFYIDYKFIVIIILLLSLIIIMHLAAKRQLVSFFSETIPLISYILIYLIVLTIVTSSLWIGVNGGALDVRKVVQIFPYSVLSITSLFIYYFDLLCIKVYNRLYTALCIFILICLTVQGSNGLYSMAINMHNVSIINYTDQNLIAKYIFDNNISNLDKVYIDRSASWPKYQMALHMRNPMSKFAYTLIANNISGKTIFDNLTSCSVSSVDTLSELIRKNNNTSTYIIVPNNVAQNYIKKSSQAVCLGNPCRFSDAIIFKASVPEDYKSSNSCKALGYHILRNYPSNETVLAGNLIDANHMAQNYDQLIVLNSSLNEEQTEARDLQIIDFVNESSTKCEYPERFGTKLRITGRPNTILIGNFAALGYDQALFLDKNLNEGEIVIEDFSEGKSPAVIRYSEVLSSNSPLSNLTGPEDSQLVGDFLALGHSQVLFMDRSSNEKRLMLADFIKSKSAQFTEIPLTGDSARIARWLDKDDLQFAGDFMGLGHGQVLFINRNHTKNKKEKLILLDFSNENSKPSIKYQENWGESNSLGGWLDVNDTQLVGDFMNLGHSQVLFVNHGKNGGKIAIIDFCKSGGKPPALTKFVDRWNGSDLFEGWLDLNDTKIAGDFKGLGYSQVLFLNSSSNGTNATIVEFASGKPLIAF